MLELEIMLKIGDKYISRTPWEKGRYFKLKTHFGYEIVYTWWIKAIYSISTCLLALFFGQRLFFSFQ